MRQCVECGTDISHRHTAAILCEACFKQRRVIHGARKTATCAICGEPVYKGTGSRPTPNCRECRAKARAERERDRTCEVCGKPRQKNAKRYCSQKCNAIARRVTVACIQCGTPFVKNHRQTRFCSRECGLVRRKDRAFAQKSSRVWKWRCLLEWRGCAICGGQFPANPRSQRRYCSPPCAHRRSYQNAYRKNPERFAKAAHKRRAIKASALVEAVTPLKVYERDKWRCHICGGKVRRKPRWKRDPEMASLDHLVPLSLGGEHSYANVACAHYRCNLSKGTRAVGEQLALIG